MKIEILAAAAIAGLAFAPLAHADDYDTKTIVNEDDTTGSIVIKKQQPTVVIEKQQPTIVIQKHQPDVIIHQDDTDDNLN